MIKRWLGIAALIVCGLGLGLTLANAGVELASHWFPHFRCYDEYRGWGLTPGAEGWYRREGIAYVRISRDGFRGPDYVQRKAPGVLRVAVLGDSFVEAIQVPEDKTFTAVIGRILANSPLLKNTRIEAMNFGVGGYGTAQELITLRRKVWRYSPDIVVLAIFLGNDLSNNSVALESYRCRPFYHYQDGRLALTGPLVDSPTYRMWCEARYDYRPLQVFVGSFEYTWEAAKRGASEPNAEYPGEPGVDDNIYKPPADRTWEEAWRVTEGLVSEMRDEVVRHHSMFLAVTVDTGMQVWPEPQTRQRFEDKLGVRDLFYPDRRIVELGDQKGFQVLNLVPVLQSYAQTHHVFLHGFKNAQIGFGHWNEEGHEQAGRSIATKLCSMLRRRWEDGRKK
jgi:hypothetical protein